MPTTSEPFRLFVDVDLPSDGESYKQFLRMRQTGKASVYVTGEQANVQVWLTGTPATLRLLATELERIAERAEMTSTAQRDSE